MKKCLLALWTLITLLSVISCKDVTASTTPAEKRTVRSANEGSSETFQSPIVIDFTAEWCGPCRQFYPIFQSAQKRYADKITFRRVDIDKYRQLAIQYHIQAVPTVIMFDKSGKEVARYCGFMDSVRFETALKKLLK